MFRKILALSSVMVMALSFCACANDGDLDITFKRKDSASALANSALDETTESEEVTTEPEATTEAAVKPQETLYTAMQEVNVRTQPSFDSGMILGQLAYGQQVSVKGIADGWAEISYNGADAYVSMDYLAQVQQ